MAKRQKATTVIEGNANGRVNAYWRIVGDCLGFRRAAGTKKIIELLGSSRRRRQQKSATSTVYSILPPIFQPTEEAIQMMLSARS
jgi:hypothetical protein